MKWKRRYFVLFKPASSLPHQYVLNYYSDENCKKLKGYIDLEHCEQIIESLDLDNFPFLLAIKTYHRSKERTYFLATETEDQMTTWVRNLCSVCGLKPEDNAADLPPDRQEVTNKEVTKSPVTHEVPKPQVNGKFTSPVVAQPQPQPSTMPHNLAHATPDRQEYIPLANCYTTKKSPFDRQVSMDSIPDEQAPPPPIKNRQDLDDGPNEVFHPSTYDTPKSRDQIDSLYKIPPPRNIKEERESDDGDQDAYDVPPNRQSPSTPRSSSSESQKADSAYSSQSGIAYDYPPPKCDNNTVLTADDVYDIPPSNPHTIIPPPRPSDIPPARPPKPVSLQEPYQNIPPNSKMFDSRNSVDINKVVPAASIDTVGMASYDLPRSSSNSISGMYDLPKSATAGSKDASLFATPPAPHTSGQTQHSYINAGTSYVKTKEEDVYLPMERAYPPGDSSQKLSPGGDPYTDMAHKPEDNYAEMARVKHSSVYDHPPARPPRISPRTASTLPDHGVEAYHIYSSSRTRSFKRNYSSNSSPPRDGLRVELPSRLDNQHPDCSTSSEDEDEHILIDPNKVFQGISLPYSQKSNIWGSTPPPPKSQDRELKYLDLELKETSDKEPVRSPHSLQTGHRSPTEYREIDFIKTQALSDVKHDVDRQRKS